MIPQTIPLGPFDLHARLGQGGMGEVWRGVHRAQGVPVAVKLLLHSFAATDRFVTVFRNEVRSIARLSHPAIVMVLDHGAVDGAAAEASRGKLHEGSPYLAMEYASAGSLEDAADGLSWPDARDALLAVLDALAHAHARGVLHRDIKPANVLIAGSGDLRPGIKLSDFGLAHAVHDHGGSDRPLDAGTPEYMAPEQVRGLWREQGPWTDLYALGCLAMQLVTGEVPFRCPTRSDVLRMHLEMPVPPMTPRFPVPPALEAWIRQLLAKRPIERFRTAADAACALRDLDRPVAPRSGPLVTVRSGRDASTWALVDSEPEAEPPTTALGPNGAPHVAYMSRPPLPAHWQSPFAPRPPPRLVGAGLGLFGMRAVPLVGRVVERDIIWETLRDVTTTVRPRAIALHGPSGIGKSALATWTAERAVELGAASLLWATHSPLPTPVHGLARMAARHLRCLGLDADDLRRRLARLADEPQVGDRILADQLGHLFLASGGGDRESGRFQPGYARPEERYAILGRLLARLAVERPLILSLEDVQWGGDTLAFVRWLLDRPAEDALPILLILTCRDEALGTRPVEREAIAELEARADVRALTLKPLNVSESTALVQDLLLMEDSLVERVQRRTAGNPLFAVQLVGDWVRRGVLEVSGAGFVLKAGEQAVLPDDIHVAWRGWLDELLRGLQPGARESMEVAAALGREVDHDEWAVACASLGLVVADGLVDGLIGAHLAEPRGAERKGDGWVFVHGMLRESVEREAREADRWSGINRACAAMLTGRPDTPGRLGRLARHLVAAEDFANAVGPLREGADHAVRVGEYREAAELVAMREAALEALAVGPDDIRRGENAVIRIRLFVGQGQFEEADRLAARAAETARRQRWMPVQVKALRYRGIAAQKRGDLSLAEAMFTTAETFARANGQSEDLAVCIEHRGTILRQRGDGEGSLELLEEALALFRAMAFPPGAADCLREIGGTLITLGRGEAAEAPLREAIAIYDSLGLAIGRATCLNNLGDVLRGRGDMDGAEGAYRHALDVMERLGYPERVFPMWNLGMMLLARGAPLDARDVLLAALDVAERSRRKSVQGLVHVALLATVAALHDWAAFDHHLDLCSALFAETGMVDPEIVRCAETAAGSAHAGGERARGAAAEELAVAQRESLGAG